MAEPRDPGNEFSRAFCRADLAGECDTVHLEANAKERAALAVRLGLVAVGALDAHLEVRAWRRDGLAVSGRFRAVVVQTCVITLDPFETVVEEEVSARFAPAGSRAAEASRSQIEIDPLADDEAEVLVEGCADLGELIVEQLSTGLDAHPRKPGSDFQAVLSELDPRDPDTDDAGSGPFAALAQLRRDGEKS